MYDMELSLQETLHAMMTWCHIHDRQCWQKYM